MVRVISYSVNVLVYFKISSRNFLFGVFGRVEKEKAQAVEQQAKVSEQKKAEEFKAQMEAQLKQQRLAAQQVG